MDGGVSVAVPTVVKSMINKHASIGTEKYDLLLLIPRWVREVVCTCVGDSRAPIVIVK